MGFQDLPAEIHDLIFKELVSECWKDIWNARRGVPSARVLNKRLVCKRFSRLISHHAVRTLKAQTMRCLDGHLGREALVWILYELSANSSGTPASNTSKDGGESGLVNTIQQVAQKACRLLRSEKDDGDDGLFEYNLRKAACQAAVETVPYLQETSRGELWRHIEGRVRDIVAHLEIRDHENPSTNDDGNLEPQSTSLPLLSESCQEAAVEGDILCVLAYHGDVHVVQRFLNETNVDLNHVSRWFGSPVYAAARKEEAIPVIQLLLDRGAAVDTMGGVFNNTPLQVASRHGLREVAHLLLGHGADPNLEGGGHKGMAKVPMEPDQRMETMGMCGWTALHQAVSCGHVDVVELFLNIGLDVNARNFFTATPLHLAIEGGHSLTTMLLLERGAQVNVLDSLGNSPLSLAAGKKQENIVRTLLQRGADVNLTAEALSLGRLNKMTPLHFGAMEGHYAITKMLLEKGAHVDGEDISTNTPLHFAIAECHNEVVRLLLDYGATIDDDRTCRSLLLQILVARENFPLIRILVENGANAQAKGSSGNTVLHRAAEKGRVDMCQYLVEKGCPVNMLGPGGCTPLFKAAESGKKETVEFFLKTGADINMKDKKGRTPLHIAILMGNRKISHLLIEEGADIQVEDERKYTPLHLAVSNGADLVQTLIDKGALLERETTTGHTPLHVASWEGWPKVVQILLKNNANPNPRSVRGMTPLGLVVKRESGRLETEDHEEVEKLLRQYGAIE